MTKRTGIVASSITIIVFGYTLAVWIITGHLDQFIAAAAICWLTIDTIFDLIEAIDARRHIEENR